MLRWSLLMQTFTSSSSSSSSLTSSKKEGAEPEAALDKQAVIKLVSAGKAAHLSAGDGEIWWGFYFSGGISRGAAELMF